MLQSSTDSSSGATSSIIPVKQVNTSHCRVCEEPPQPLYADTRANDEAKQWAEKIRLAYAKSVKSVLECGRTICDAKKALSHGDFHRMISQELPFGPRTAQRLMTIGSDERFANATHASHLPASWNTLYELSKLADAVFDRSVASGRIHPEMKRKDAIALQGSPSSSNGQLELFEDTEFLLSNAGRKLEKALRRHQLAPVKLAKNSVAIIEIVITAIRTMHSLVRGACERDALSHIATEIERLEDRVNSLMGPSKLNSDKV